MNKLYVITGVNAVILGTSAVIFIFAGNRSGFRADLKKSSDALSSFCSKLTAFLLMLYRTFLTYPALQCVYSLFICGGESPYFKESDSFSCFSSNHVGHLVLGVANLIFLLGVMVFNFLFINDPTPSSELPFAGFYNKNWIFEILMKFFIPLMTIIDFNGEYRIMLLFFTSVYLILCLAVLLQSNPLFNPMVQRFKVVLKTTQLIWYLGIAIRCSVAKELANNEPNSKVNSEILSFILIIIGHLPVCYLALSIQESRENRILLQNPKSVKTSSEAEFLICTLIRMIKDRNKGNNYVKIHGYLRLHSKTYGRLRKEGFSTTPQSQSKGMVKEEQRELSIRNTVGHINQKGLGFHNPWVDLMDEKWLKRINIEDQDLGEDLEQKAQNRFIEFVMKECLSNFPKSASLRLYLALFKHHTMKTKWQSIYLLMQIIISNSSFLRSFTAQRTLTQIEKQLRVEDEASQGEVGLDVTSLVKFTHKFREFIHLLKTSVERSREFWCELAKETPDAKKFMALGCSILNLDPVVKKKFDELVKFEIKTGEIYSLYAGYIQDVIHDEDNNTDVIDRAERFLRSERMASQSYGDLEKDLNLIAESASRMSIIEVSGSEESLGEVLNASNSTWQIFGYKPKEMIGNNVSTLMHSYYAEKHDGFLKRYFERENSEIVNLNRMVMAKHSSGYLICCKLLLKVLPDLSRGVRLVGILTECDQRDLKMVKELEKNISLEALNKPIHLIQVIQNTGEVIGISESCHSEFGLKASFFDRRLNSNPPDGQLLFPGLLDTSSMEQLKSENGVDCVIDTSLLNDNYYFVGNSNDKRGGLVRNTNKKQRNESDYSFDEDSEQSKPSYFDSKVKESEESSATESLEHEPRSEKLMEVVFRKVSIKIWMQASETYGEETVLTLSFIESFGSNEDNSEDQSFEEYEESVQDLDQRIKNRRLLQKPRLSQTTLQNISNLSQDDSFDQLRTVNQTRDAILQKKKGLIKTLIKFYYFALTCWIICLSIGYYLDIKSLNNIERNYLYRQAMYRRILTIFDISSQNRKLELISSGWFNNTRNVPDLQDLSVKRLGRESDKLVHFEKLSVNGLSLMKNSEPFSRRAYKYPFFYKLKSGQESHIESSYHDGVFQYLSSTSVIKNAKMGDLASDLDEKLPLTAERIQFHRIRYNSMNSLRTGSKEIIRDFDQYCYSTVYKHTIHTYYCFLVSLMFFTVSLICSIFCFAMILDNEGDVLHVFALIEYHEVEELVLDLEEFTDVQLREFLAAEDSDYEIHDSYDESEPLEFEKLDEIEEEVEGRDETEDLSKKSIKTQKIRKGSIKHSGYENGNNKQEMPQKYGKGGKGIIKMSKSRKKHSLKEKSLKSKNGSESRRTSQSNRRGRKRTSTTLLMSQKIFAKKMDAKYNSLKKASNSKVSLSHQRASKLRRKSQLENISKSSQTTTKSTRFKRARKSKIITNGTSKGSLNILNQTRNTKSKANLKKAPTRLLPAKKLGIIAKPERKVSKLNCTMKFRLSAYLGTIKNRRGPEDSKNNDSDEDESKDEELVVERVKRLKKQKKKTCNGLSLKALASCFLLGGLYNIGTIWFKYSSNESLLFVDTNFVKLGTAPVYLKIIYNLMVESLSEAKHPIGIQGEELFLDYVRKSYENLGALSQDTSFPGMLSLYKGYFSKLYFIEVCEAYLQKVSNKDCSDQLFRSSLETISISIIENSKKILRKFNDSKRTQSSARELMNSLEALKLERVVDLTVEIFEYLFDQYQKSRDRGFTEYELWSIFILFGGFLLSIFVALVITYSIKPSLKKEVMETRGMLKLIPKEVLRQNKRIQNIILGGKSQRENRPKRLRLNRRG